MDVRKGEERREGVMRDEEIRAEESRAEERGGK